MKSPKIPQVLELPFPSAELIVVNRRQFLSLAGGTLVGLGGVGLVGCGGSTRAKQTLTGTQLVSGSVIFPGGLKPLMGPLNVSNWHGASSVNSQMTFSVPALSSGPSLVSVVTASDQVVFMGFVDPSTNTNPIGCASTAIALIYLTLGCSSFLEGNRAQILKVIAQDAATANLTKIIASRVLSQPLAVGAPDPTISQAVVTACQAIMAEITPAAQNKQLQPRANSTLSLTPDNTTQSGDQVNLTKDGLGFTATNSYRLERMMYVYNVGHVDSSGMTLPLSPKPVLTPLAIKPIEQLNVITGFQQLFGVGREPITTVEIPLSLDSGFPETLYGIVVIGPGKQNLTGKSPAPLFGNATYSNLVPEWQLTSTGLFNKTVLLTFISLFLEFVGLNSSGHGSFEPYQAAATDTLVENLLEIQDAGWQSAIEEFTQGNFPTAFIELVEAAFGNLTVFEAVCAALLNFLATLELGNSTLAFLQGAVKHALHSLLGVYHATNAALVLADIINTEKQLLESNVGELWNIGDKKNTVKISPSSTSFVPGGSPIEFMAAPVGEQTEIISWEWTLAGGVIAKLTDSGSNQGTNFTTKSATVFLITTPLDIDSMTVTVEGFIEAGVKETSIGTALSSVTIGGVPTIKPGVMIVQGFIEYSALTVIAAFATFREIKGAFGYSWTSPSVLGHVVYGQTHELALNNGTLPTLDLTKDLNAQISSAPGGTFVIGNGLYGFFGGYIEYSEHSQGTPTLAEATSYMDGTFATVNDIQVSYS